MKYLVFPVCFFVVSFLSVALAELNGVLLIIIGELGWPMHVISDVVKLACRLWILEFFSEVDCDGGEALSFYVIFLLFRGRQSKPFCIKQLAYYPSIV